MIVEKGVPIHKFNDQDSNPNVEVVESPGTNEGTDRRNAGLADEEACIDEDDDEDD